MKKKLYYIFLVSVLVIAIIFNIVKTLNYDLTMMYIHMAEQCTKMQLYDLSNVCYTHAQKLNHRAIRIDYNIAKNIVNKNWNKPLTPSKKQELEKAIKLLDIENQKYPNNVNIYTEYAYAYDEIQDFDKAIEYYEKIVQIDPQWEYGFQRLANLYCVVKFDYPKALYYINKKMQLNINKRYYGDYFVKAYILDMMGNYDDAVKYYKKYIENNKTHVAGFVNIAICELMLGRYEDAEKHVNEGLKYAPDFSYLLNLKIKIFKYKHNFAEAKKLANELIARDEYDDAAYFNLAEIYRYENDTTKAEEYYNYAKNKAKEYYDKFCENPYDINDLDGRCRNRYIFLNNFEKEKNKPLKF
jgi:tetratricopeptide (TPR) repeat protein